MTSMTPDDFDPFASTPLTAQEERFLDAWDASRLTFEDARAQLLLTVPERLVYVLQDIEPELPWHEFIVLVGEQLPRLTHKNVRAGDVIAFLKGADARDLTTMMTPREQRELRQLTAYVKLYACPTANGSWLRWYLTPEAAQAHTVKSQRTMVFTCLAHRTRTVLKFGASGTFFVVAEQEAVGMM